MDQRSRFVWYITVFAGIIILYIQFIYLHSLHNEEKYTFTTTQNNRIQSAIYEFNIKSTDPVNIGNWLNFNSKENFLKYFIKGDTCLYYLDPKDDLTQVDIRAIYDIRDPKKWTLERFYAYLQTKLDSITIQNLSFHFSVIDSVGKTIDTYPTQSLFSPSCEYIIPLGFISRDTLYVTYQYPINLFLKTSCWNIILITLITLLLSLCIVNLYQTVRNEKKNGKYRELFINNLVHDLKRPIENQIKICHLLKDSHSLEQATLLEQNQKQLNEMLQSINRMLLQSTDSHGILLIVKEFNLQEMLKVLSQYDRWEIDKNKQFDIQVHFLTENKIISGDYHFLFAAFFNLVDNSLKYSGNQVDISITCMDIDDQHVQIKIEDNGFGISPNNLKHVFECYNRGDYQANREINGHGQGLHYVHTVILAHRGKINIESEKGKGTTVLVILPRSIKSKNKKHC